MPTLRRIRGARPGGFVGSQVTRHRATVGGRTRPYGLLETIRQFAEDQLAATGTIDDARDRHARYYAADAIIYAEMWETPRQLDAFAWLRIEFSNLRTGFRWATDRHDLNAAAAIAAHAAWLCFALQRFEPVGWAEEILSAATAADVDMLPRLYVGAAFCSMTGRSEFAVGYAETAAVLEADPRYRPFPAIYRVMAEALGHLFCGRMERWLELNAVLADMPGVGHLCGACGLAWALPAVGRSREAMAFADDALAAARSAGNPYYIAYALCGYMESDPVRALGAAREGLRQTRDCGLEMWETLIARDAARLEALHGNLVDGLALFDTTLDSFHRTGLGSNVAQTLGELTTFFDRFDRPEIAATIYGNTTSYASTIGVIDLLDVVDHLRSALGSKRFDECVAAGAAMELADSVRYARAQIQLVRSELAEPS